MSIPFLLELFFICFKKDKKYGTNLNKYKDSFKFCFRFHLTIQSNGNSQECMHNSNTMRLYSQWKILVIYCTINHNAQCETQIADVISLFCDIIPVFLTLDSMTTLVYVRNVRIYSTCKSVRHRQKYLRDFS